MHIRSRNSSLERGEPVVELPLSIAVLVAPLDSAQTAGSEIGNPGFPPAMQFGARRGYVRIVLCNSAFNWGYGTLTNAVPRKSYVGAI